MALLRHVFAGNIVKAKKLLEEGADIDLMDPASGSTLLLVAAESNDAEMLSFLLENGADISLASVRRTGASSLLSC